MNQDLIPSETKPWMYRTSDERERSSMTDQEKNTAVATKLGWTRIESHEGAIYGCPPDFFREDGSPRHNSIPAVPDYGNDLNAMHEAEKVLEDTRENDEWSKYCVELNRISCRIKCRNTSTCGYTIAAPADQRREAFGRTFNLWKDP